ncbi:hypothetical protein AGJ35_07905 [Cronobacter dublinensis subsp. dublinensis]|nr:hypothetical protein [Cronobacter dublinensis subsp. dublinensis]EGT5735327.1 hypothetical protein [Cronobacter dublinensis subsp. dublinensis]
MKSNTTFMACCGLFCSFIAGAATANDTPVNLNIHGQLVNVPQDICHIELSKDSMAFTNAANTLPKQGEYNSWYVTPLLISVKSKNIYNFDNTCGVLIANGHLGIKVIGIPGDAENDTLANTMAGDSAAQGVGINLFTDPDTTQKINSFIDMSKAGFSGHTLISVGMVRLNGKTVTPGDIQSSVTFELVTL